MNFAVVQVSHQIKYSTLHQTSHPFETLFYYQFSIEYYEYYLFNSVHMTRSIKAVVCNTFFNDRTKKKTNPKTKHKSERLLPPNYRTS